MNNLKKEEFTRLERIVYRFNSQGLRDNLLTEGINSVDSYSGMLSSQINTNIRNILSRIDTRDYLRRSSCQEKEDLAKSLRFSIIQIRECMLLSKSRSIQALIKTSSSTMFIEKLELSAKYFTKMLSGTLLVGLRLLIQIKSKSLSVSQRQKREQEIKSSSKRKAKELCFSLP